MSQENGPALVGRFAENGDIEIIIRPWHPRYTDFVILVGQIRRRQALAEAGKQPGGDEDALADVLLGARR